VVLSGLREAMGQNVDKLAKRGRMVAGVAERIRCEGRQDLTPARGAAIPIDIVRGPPRMATTRTIRPLHLEDRVPPPWPISSGFAPDSPLDNPSKLARRLLRLSATSLLPHSNQ
jgi:hypothetical protein